MVRRVSARHGIGSRCRRAREGDRAGRGAPSVGTISGTARAAAPRHPASSTTPTPRVLAALPQTALFWAADSFICLIAVLGRRSAKPLNGA